MNSFYRQPRILIWIESILLVIMGFYPAITIIELGYSQPLYYFLLLLYLPLGQFSLTPILTLTEVYNYYSPMLIGYMANKVQIDLHNGGSFDYLFVMRKFKPGIEFRNRILLYHLEGLLNLIGKIESGTIPPEVNIVGTSYFFNERTIAKLGFEEEKPSLFYRINLMVNFIDLTWMYSVAKGHFAIPKIWSARKVNIKGSQLLDQKKLISELQERINAKVNPATIKP